MSGHSKWATIKRQKGVADAKRSQVFTKLANTITVAAKNGADPTMNFKLRLAIDRAREANMPKDNIERAVKRGIGEEGGKLEEITYEAYGPGSVAMLIECLTDNKNRTSSNLRHLLERAGGRLADMGSVSWMFETKAVVQLPLPQVGRDELELLLIEAGATDLTEENEQLIITGEPANLETIKQVLTTKGLALTYSGIEPISKTTVSITDLDIENKLNNLREILEADDDVTATYDNQA
jgi:YebC/PmpR family DNA-binding regulatory protein